MGVLDDLQARAVPTAMRLFGTAGVIVAPMDGAAVTLTADLGSEEADYEDTVDGKTLVAVRRCWVGSDPAAAHGGVARIGPGDQVTADGHTYTVRLASGPSGGTWELVLVRKLLAEATRPDHRDVGGYRRRV